MIDISNKKPKENGSHLKNALPKGAGFTHLHVHSHYSLLDGLSKIDGLIDQAKQHKMKSLALTDHGVMYGVIEFYQKAREAGIKPIIGVEAYLARHSHLDKRAKIDEKPYHLILLAKNEQGYKNLIKLTTIAHLKGFYYKPRIDFELLKKYSLGLICLTACIQGEIPQLIVQKQKDKAIKRALEYQKVFGEDNFYLEVQDHPKSKEQALINKALFNISKKYNIPVVATNDVHYVKKEDAEIQDILLCLQTKRKQQDKDRMCSLNFDLSLRPEAEMKEAFKNHPEVITNTQKIVQACNLEIELKKIKLPYFPLPEGKTADQSLKELCEEKISNRYLRKTKEITNRLDYELSMIKKTGFASYFLIVQDFVNWAKNNNIVVGPGRGSVAGSIVSYILNITDIDPLKYELIFERFLTESRNEPPDIDLDFADTRRDEVIHYVEEKYGRDHVAQIITFGTMAARAAIRDVGRVLNYPYTFCDKLAKMIPFGNTLEKALQISDELKSIYQTNEDAQKIINVAKKLEGVARHASKHACGVVIAPEALCQYIPTQYDVSGGEKTIITQYDMHAVEDLGLLKMDFLGLKNLSIIEKTLKLIKYRYNKDVDITKIPLNDLKTFKLLQKAETTGVFQLESGGMKRYLKQLKPTVFDDIIAMVALYRPGPMELIPDYIAGKKGLKKPQYLHPKLKPILDKTYGIAVYQEQILQIVRDLAGFSLPEADILRKAVGKKIPKLLQQQKTKFIHGCINNKISKETAERIFAFIEPFAGYGFNKCLIGETEIIDYKTGQIFTIKQILNKKNLPLTFTLSQNSKLTKGKIAKIIPNGKKHVYKITTRLGKTISATNNHPFLQFSGWTLLKYLKKGDRIALPRLISIKNPGLKTIKKYHLILLGYILAEGNLCHPSSFYFYSSNPKEIKDYLDALIKFKNTKGKLNKSKNAVSVYAGRINLKQKSEAVEWIKNLGLQYKKAINKEFPSFVFKLNKKQLSLLLAKMFQGDGCINSKQKNPCIFYATSSEKLARQLQHLFLRLGIITSLYSKKFKYRGTIKRSYTLDIHRYTNIQKFAQTIGKFLIAEKKKTLEIILKKHPIINKKIKTNSARGSKDIIPAEVIDLIRSEIKKKNLSFKKFAQKYNISPRLFQKDKRKIGFLRETIELIGQKLNSKKLLKIARSDIYWDEITKIEHIGKQETFDLNIPHTHNFIANDFIVHNSHATCYATISYQTAYLKANYPAEFIAALLTAHKNDTDRISIEVEEARKMGLNVLPPDINESFKNFTVVDKKNIRFGLIAIKNVGEGIVQTIIKEREENGIFQNLEDFLGRINSKNLNKKSMESLVKSGAMSKFGERNHLLNNMETLLEFVRKKQKEKNNGQTNLFKLLTLSGKVNLKLKKSDPATQQERLLWEREHLGFFISEHPLKQYQEVIKKYVKPINQLELSNGLKSSSVKILGLITKIKKITTSSNQHMIFVKLEDSFGEIEVIVFPKILKSTSKLWEENKMVSVEGRLSDKDGQLKLLAENVKEVTKNMLDDLLLKKE